MNLSAVALTPGGATQPAATTWNVTAKVASGFQTVLYLRIDTHGAPDDLRVDVAGSQFAAVFQSFDYNAIGAAALSASKDGKAVIVKLDGARQVTGITTNPSKTIELHRADGPVQADKAAESSGFTDVNFAIQAADASILTVNQVTAVNVRSQPGNPRIGIAAVDLKTPAIFWPTPETAGQLQVSAGAAFAKALQTHLSARWEQARKDNQMPNYLDVAIVAQSDAPCRLTISQFHVAVHWLLSSFPSGDEKQVLRFSGKRVERQSVAVQIPAAAVVASATVRANESFPGGGAPSFAQAGPELLADQGQLSGDRGVRISAGGVQRGGQRVTPPGAMSVAGIALGMMALSPGTQLGIEVQTDRNGSPSGQAVAGADLKIDQPGQQQWTVARMKEPVTLPGAPYWVVVTALKGSVIWLAENGADPVRIFENVEGRISETARLDGRAAMVRALPPTPLPPAPAGPNQPGPAPSAQARLSVGAGSPNGTLQADGSRLFNVTSQVNAFLASARAHSPQATVAAIPFVFTAGGGGLITVYPPEISYDVQ